MENTPLTYFSEKQIKTVHRSAELAEILVSDHFKMSESQWLRSLYDIKTLAALTGKEIVYGPLAQVVLFRGVPSESSLPSVAYDFYKICLQDHAILTLIDKNDDISLYPLCLYVIVHELIHIIRFSRYNQNYDAPQKERDLEEKRVHQLTHEIFSRPSVEIEGIISVLLYYEKWRKPVDRLSLKKNAPLPS